MYVNVWDARPRVPGGCGMIAGVATYIAFLRAINLGAKRKFPKDAIRAAVEAAGGDRVETYINTGNVRLDSTHALPGPARGRAGGGLRRRPGLRGADDRLHPGRAAARSPRTPKRFADGHEGRHYVSLLKQEPSAEAVSAGRGGRRRR